MNEVDQQIDMESSPRHLCIQIGGNVLEGNCHSISSNYSQIFVGFRIIWGGRRGNSPILKFVYV